MLPTWGTIVMVLAYLDPSTGGLLLQTLVAALVAVPFVLRTQIGRGIQFIRRRGRPAVDEDQQSQTD